MTDAANTPPTTRTARVLTTVFVVIAVAYMGLMTFISVPQLTDYIGGRDIDFPVFLAIAAVAGPALFWAYIGLGFGLTVVGRAAGIALTGILTSLTYGWLLASSDGHGFSYWLFLTTIVGVTLGAFCVMPYALVRGTIRSR
ncbi:hypothetical protein ACIGQE_27520 [Streptomyces sp. NPDC053429]|uniref:hypothetical protein n=1 Tax=Streptomyces sp. NPDC053429 TaxID=3365702 RepID=UPI0037CF06CE